jgi:hypothetical protein
VLPKLLSSTGVQASRAAPDANAKPVVVYVRAGISGDVKLISGEREVVINDAQLVSRLRSASAG